MADILRNFIYRRAADPLNQPRPVLDPGMPGDPTAGEGYIERPTTGGEKALAAILPILGALQGIQPRDRETGKVRFDVGQAAQGVAGGLLGGLGNIHERKLQEHKSWWEQQQAGQDAAFKNAGLTEDQRHNVAMENRPPRGTMQPEGPPGPPTIEEHRTPSGGILTLVNGKPVTPYREKPVVPRTPAATREKPIGGIVNVQSDIDSAQKELDSLLMRRVKGKEAVAARSRRISELRKKLADLKGLSSSPSTPGSQTASDVLKGTAFDQGMQ